MINRTREHSPNRDQPGRPRNFADPAGEWRSPFAEDRAEVGHLRADFLHHVAGQCRMCDRKTGGLRLCERPQSICQTRGT